ncbi:MAG: tetratricopeptide repeat protein, partial [Thermoanaerobaculia bacterium]
AKDDSPVHRKLGLALFSASEYAAAVKPLSLAMQTNPGELDLQLKMGRALIESGDLQRAVDLTQTGGKRFPKAPQLPALAIVAFAKMKRYRDAQGAFEKAIGIDAKSPDAHVARGFAYLDEGKPNEAVASFRSATQADPERAEAYYGLGFAANRALSYEEALTNLKRAVDLKPDYAEAWYAMKTTYEGLKKFNAAVEALNKAVALNPHLTA